MEELNKLPKVAEQPIETIQSTKTSQTENDNKPELANSEPDKPEAGCFGIGVAVLFPLIGVIIYFVQKNEVKNPKAYLYGALGGFMTGLIMNIIIN